MVRQFEAKLHNIWRTHGHPKHWHPRFNVKSDNISKAIQGSEDYSEQFTTLVHQKLSPIDCYWQLVLRDINSALQIFEPLYESSSGLDGFVSVEVDPSLAHEQSETLLAARELDEQIKRPNVMIKIPATVEGIPVIKTMISEGRNVNVTLIFSLERYQEVIDAYIEGLEILATTNPKLVSSVSSVASFFISRVDTEIDRQLEQVGSDQANDLLGTAAINQAKLAYQMFKRSFAGRDGANLHSLAQMYKDRCGHQHQLRIRNIPTHFMLTR